MAFMFEEEREIEGWLAPLSALAVLPGYRRCRIEQTRLFWNAYWGLLRLGFTEAQLADYALAWQYRTARLPAELALALSVLHLADDYAIERPAAFAVTTSLPPRS